MEAVYLGDFRALARTVFGHKIFVDTRDEGIAPHILLDGQWEEWVGTAMDHFLPGSLFFDVGANFGWYSLRAAKKGARKIVSFEPNERLFELLSSTMEVNGIACELHLKGLGETANLMLLWAEHRAMGSGRCMPFLEEQDLGPPRKGDRVVSRRVLIETLDEVVTDLVYREPVCSTMPVVLKIDVEGFEPKVVKGAEQLFQEARSITAFIEHNPEAVGFEGMLDFLEAHRYVLSLVEHTGAIRRISRSDLQKVPPAEMLCFRRFEE